MEPAVPKLPSRTTWALRDELIPICAYKNSNNKNELKYFMNPIRYFSTDKKHSP
jgi:hypothetical protein